MKNYEWVEYEKVSKNRIAAGNALRISVVNSTAKNRRQQMAVFIPEHLCRSANMRIGDRFNVRWTSDRKVASIYASKDGYKLALSGGVKKGESEKAAGHVSRATLKITLDDRLKEIFFPDSIEPYLPETISISTGNIVFRISDH